MLNQNSLDQSQKAEKFRRHFRLFALVLIFLSAAVVYFGVTYSKEALQAYLQSNVDGKNDRIVSLLDSNIHANRIRINALINKNKKLDSEDQQDNLREIRVLKKTNIGLQNQAETYR